VEISVRRLAEELIRQINPAARLEEEELRKRPKDSEVERLLGSNQRLRSLTGWQPRFSLAAGLAETIAWLRQPANLARYKTQIYNL
jgi:nucleoside-diphosphate-sugar epimerase